MTLEREALVFLMERVRQMDRRNQADSRLLLQMWYGLESSPLKEPIAQRQGLAKDLISSRLDPEDDQRFEEIIRRLKES